MAHLPYARSALAGKAQDGCAPPAGGGAKAGVMSSAHRTALAKLPDAIAWLVGALGGAGIGGCGGSQEGTGSGRCGDSMER